MQLEIYMSHVCIDIYIYIHVCVRMCKYIYIYIFIFMYICKYIYIYIFVYFRIVACSKCIILLTFTSHDRPSLPVITKLTLSFPKPWGAQGTIAEGRGLDLSHRCFWSFGYWLERRTFHTWRKRWRYPKRYSAGRIGSSGSLVWWWEISDSWESHL